MVWMRVQLVVVAQDTILFAFLDISKTPLPIRDARRLAGGLARGLARATSGAANWRERQLAGAPTGGTTRDPDGVGAVGPTHPGGLAAAPSLVAARHTMAA